MNRNPFSREQREMRRQAQQAVRGNSTPGGSPVSTTVYEVGGNDATSGEPVAYGRLGITTFAEGFRLAPGPKG